MPGTRARPARPRRPSGLCCRTCGSCLGVAHWESAGPRTFLRSEPDGPLGAGSNGTAARQHVVDGTSPVQVQTGMFGLPLTGVASIETGTDNGGPAPRQHCQVIGGTQGQLSNGTTTSRNRPTTAVVELDGRDRCGGRCRRYMCLAGDGHGRVVGGPLHAGRRRDDCRSQSRRWLSGLSGVIASTEAGTRRRCEAGWFRLMLGCQLLWGSSRWDQHVRARRR